MIFQLFPQVMSLITEWRSQHRRHAIMVACLALEAMMKDQVEQLNTATVSLRAGSLVPRTGEARKSVGKARKSEPARELLIFEFRPSRGVKSAFHMCQII